jgi:hypothetical protein
MPFFDLFLVISSKKDDLLIITAYFYCMLTLINELILEAWINVQNILKIYYLNVVLPE